MPKNPLSHEEILELRAAVLSARLGESRAALLTGIQPLFVAGLAHAAKPGEQVLQDLEDINAAGTLTDGSVPLLTWLQNAVALVGLRAEARVFEAARDRCRALVAPPVTVAPTTRAPQSAQGKAFEDGPFAVILREHSDTPVVVNRSPFRIGRAPQMDYAVTDGDVSRHHTTVVREGNDFIIEDQGSSHGTLVNGIRASRMRLRSDDILDVGSCRLTIRVCDSLAAVDAEIERAARLFDRHRILTTHRRPGADHDAGTDGWFIARIQRAIAEAEPAHVCFVELERAGTMERVYGAEVARKISDHIASTLSFQLPLTMSLVSISASKIAVVGTWNAKARGELHDEVKAHVPREMPLGTTSVRFSVQVHVTDVDGAVEMI